MGTPVLSSADMPPLPGSSGSGFAAVRPTAVLLLRTPVPPSAGTDPYHDVFGPFCLPSFPLSALESGSSTPLPPPVNPHVLGREGADILKSALQSSATGRRRGRWIADDDSLTTTHLARDGDDEREWCVSSIPILGHRLVESHELARRILSGPVGTAGDQAAGGKYRGVVVTSQRAVDAWGEAAQHVSQELRDTAAREGKPAAPTTLWQRTPFFAVGPATATALRQLGPSLPQPLRPALVMGGGATGTGEALANYVTRHFGPLDSEAEPPAPILVLVGDKNAPTIPDMLRAKGYPIEVLQVYETCLDEGFDAYCEALSRTLPAISSRPGSRRPSRSGSFSSASGRRPSFGVWAERRGSGTGTPSENGPTAALGALGGGTTPLGGMTPFSSIAGAGRRSGSPQQMAPGGSVVEDEEALPLDSDIGLSTGTGTKPDWLVFFSPSGLQYALPTLRARRWLPPADAPAHPALSAGAPDGFPRVACLGPTTKRAVKELLGFAPDAVASAPEPVELREAIRGAESRIRRERERWAEKLRVEREEREERRNNPDPDNLIEMDTSA